MTIVHTASVAPVASENGTVVAAQHLASKVDVEVLKRDDNAIDAAVAVDHAPAAVYPTAGNLGSGGFMTIRLADSRKTFLNLREVAPKVAIASMYLGKGGNVIKGTPTKEHLTVGVLGTVSGMEYARGKCDTMQYAALIAPAITLADKGFILDQGDVDILHTSIKDFQEDAALGTIFLNEGQPFQVGEKLVQHDLTKTLREISKHGTDGFYKSWVGQTIAAPSKTGGDLIAQDDLVSHKTHGLTPVECGYRGYHVVSALPPSSGGVIICKILNILGGYLLKDLGWHSVQATYYQIEAMCHAYVDRNSYLNDPDFMKNPLDRPLNRDYAAKIRVMIDPKKVGVSKDIKSGVEPHEGSNTTYYSIADGYGNVVSVMYTSNDRFGTRATAAEVGVILNDEVDDFTAKIGVPNLYGLMQGEASPITPGKHPLSLMSPTVVTRDGKSVMMVGMLGGSRAITAVILTMINVIDHGMNVQEAVDIPRFHRQWLPDVINVEAHALSEDTCKTLTPMGHNLGALQPANHLVVIIIGAPSLGGKSTDNNRFYGVNDPYRDTGLAVGY